ncbi:YciI family protein [Luteimonas aquatica]|uniref:YciI family protein n=1 Tax=Luteimonas aquatica TaxID=450364 RepID=UPI001F58CDFC|nr:YciI family protein [Luteimonas aquatica]
MQFVVLIYDDKSLAGELPEGEYDEMMRGCIRHADELRESGHLLASQKLQEPSTAKTIRVRNGRSSVVDGPFAETKEVLGGFNLIEAKDWDEAMRIAHSFPWARTGSVEVRPVDDFDAVRRAVGA